MTQDVDRGLAALREALAQVHAPAALEGALVARFSRQHRASERPRLWWMPPLALAATFALATWMVRTAPPPLEEPPVADAQDGPFLALRPLERIAEEQGSTVVTTQFPRALLADWGLPVAPERAAEPVRAQMLYSADGEPLAVRLIQ